MQEIGLIDLAASVVSDYASNKIIDKVIDYGGQVASKIGSNLVKDITGNTQYHTWNPSQPSHPTTTSSAYSPSYHSYMYRPTYRPSSSVVRRKRTYRRRYPSRYSRGPSVTSMVNRHPLKSKDLIVTGGPLSVIGSATGGVEPNVTWSGALMTYLNQIAQGSAFYERVGSTVNMYSVLLDFSINTTSITLAAPVMVRTMLVYDTAPAGAMPTRDNLLADNASGPTFFSSINYANRKRFQVLYDKIRTLQSTGPTTYTVRKYLKLKGRTTDYGANGGTIADIQKGSLLLVAYFIPQLAGSTGVTLTPVHCRIRYSD